MIGRPTTEQILLDCCRELMEDVLPTLTDETTIVRVAMIEQVLRNAAARCAHEIGWMLEELPVIDGLRTGRVRCRARTTTSLRPSARPRTARMAGWTSTR